MSAFNFAGTDQQKKVKELSGGIASDHPRRRAIANAKKLAADASAPTEEQILAHAAEAVGMDTEA